jgi:hypothetical protein
VDTGEVAELRVALEATSDWRWKHDDPTRMDEVIVKA